MNNDELPANFEIEITSTSEAKETTSKNKRDGERDPEKAPEKGKNDKEEKIEKKLWNVARKYKTLLDSGEVPPIRESEEDRESVSEAYREIETQRHRNLDARVYNSLTKMQRTRDTKVAMEGTTEKDRLKMIAWEVKIRQQPVMFTPGDSTLNMSIFNTHDGNSIQILEGKSDSELLIEDNILEGKGIAILENLPLRNLTKEQKIELREKIINIFADKTFTKNEFETKLDSILADLISLMVREKQIQIQKLERDKYQIVSANEILEKNSEELMESQSLVIQPKLSVLNKKLIGGN